MAKVFVIDSMNEHGTIIARGESGPKKVQQDLDSYTYVDGKGPYNSSFVFLDTLENEKLFTEHVALARKLNKEVMNHMYQTLNAMKRS